jgi:alkylation response protein AidB-like acyl-CoA dehydrogenase
MIDPLVLMRTGDRLAGWLQQADDLAVRFAERAPQHDREGSFPFENFADLRAARFHLLTVPEEYGGWGATMPEAIQVVERLARGDGATALVFDMHVQVLGSLSESRSWDETRFAAFCRQIGEETALINSCATEPELGSPSRGGLPATRARWTGDGWTISGRKTFSSGSVVLTHVLVPALLDNGAQGSVGVFMLPMERPGMRIEETWDVMGMRTTASHDLVLEEVPAAPGDLVQRRDPGAPDPGRSSGGAWFGMTISGVYLGVAEAARDAAISFAQQRRPTALQGQPIATLENIQRLVGALEAELLTARALLYSIADAWHQCPEQRSALMPNIGLCKVVATTSAVKATDLALRVVGGQSMSRALPLERLFRDVRAGLFHPPTEEAAHTSLGKRLLDL